MKNPMPYALRPTLILLFIFSNLGCEAFVRKFTRKPKKENLPKEEMVLAPEEYKVVSMSRQDLYQQYFLFWRCWQDELIEALSVNSTNRKKRIDCANEALKNLSQIRALLSTNLQGKLDIQIRDLSELRDLIRQDLYGSSINSHRQRAEKIRRNIFKDFSYNRTKGDLG